ncbi:MAG: DUF3256 family protein [Prevotella sp.]|nr:DUF3256 family protein [Prevotella sp.]
MTQRAYLLLALFWGLSSLQVSSQTLRELWMSMPSDVLVYLDNSQRKELLDYYDMGVKAEVKTLLGEEAVLDTLTANYLSLTASASSRMQMRLLPAEDGDTLICMVRTFHAPAAESDVFLYTKSWSLIGKLEFEHDGLVSRPADMPQAEFEELKSSLMPFMISALLSSDNEELALCASNPFTDPKTAEKIRDIFLQRKLKWNGKTFK